MAILEIRNLKKTFGSLTVIDGLSFNVPQNTVFGFIGKNGSGKTTTMKMIMGFLKPTGGDILVCGQKVRYADSSTNRSIGYLPDVPEFYNYMTPKEYLKLCGKISGMNNDQIKRKSDELLILVGLENTNRRITGFSRGMKQRLGIAQALLNEPKLLICDEPTSALDPMGRKEILDILSAIRNRTTILFSTHILSDVERICDRIGMLDNGKLAIQGELSEIKHTYRKDRILIETQNAVDLETLSVEIKRTNAAKEMTVEGKSILIDLEDIDNSAQRILDTIVHNKINIIKYEILEPSLENVFLEAVK